MKGNFNSLTDLAMEIDRVEQTKNDYLVSNQNMYMNGDTDLYIAGVNQDFVINDFAHGQIASKLGIPKRYYDDMTAIPELRTTNVNSWMKHSKNKYFVRTLDGKARAFLSDSYRPIDNYDVMSAFLPSLKEVANDVKTCALTEKKMYMQVVFPKMEMEITKGDVVQQGFILTNSEVGAGAIDLKHLIWRLVCSNGMIGMSTLRKYHIGAKMNSDDAGIFKDDTMRADLESFKLRFRDILTDMMSQKNFIEQCSLLKLAVDDKILKVNDTVSNVTKRFGLTEKHNDVIINNMAEEGNMNRYGLANGITALAHSLDNIDAQYEVEKMGSMVINMTRNEWNKYVA